MALSLGKLVVPVSANTSKFHRRMRAAMRDTVHLSRHTDRLNKKMSKGAAAASALSLSYNALATSIQVVSMATVAATAALGYVGVAAADAFLEFETALAEVENISGATTRELAALEKQAVEMSKRVGSGAKDLLEGQKFLSMAGLSASEVLRSMESSAKLSKIAFMDFGTTADLVSNIVTAFEADISELDHIVEVMANTITSSNTDMRQMGDAMKYIGPLASAANHDIEEVAASIGLLGNAGLQGEMGGTALRNVLTRLMNPTGKSKKLIEELGIEVYDTSGEMHSMVDILKQFEEAGLHSADAMAIFAQRAGPAFQALLSQGSEKLHALTEANRESTVATEMYLNILDTGAVRIQNFIGVLEDYKRTIGDELSTALLVSIREFTDWEDSLVESHTSVKLATQDFILASLDGVKAFIEGWKEARKPLIVFGKIANTIFQSTQVTAGVLVATVAQAVKVFWKLVEALQRADIFLQNALGNIEYANKLQGMLARARQEIEKTNKIMLSAGNLVDDSANSITDSWSGINDEFRESDKVLDGLISKVSDFQGLVGDELAKNNMTVDPGMSMLPADYVWPEDRKKGRATPDRIDLSKPGKGTAESAKAVADHTGLWLSNLEKTQPMLAANERYVRAVAEIEAANLNTMQKEQALAGVRQDLEERLLEIRQTRRDKVEEEIALRQKARRETLAGMVAEIEKWSELNDKAREHQELQKSQIMGGLGNQFAAGLSSDILQEDVAQKNMQAELEYLEQINDQAAIKNKLAAEHNEKLAAQIDAFGQLAVAVQDSTNAYMEMADAVRNAETPTARLIAQQQMQIGLMQQAQSTGGAMFKAMGMGSKEAAIAQAILNGILAATALGMGLLGHPNGFAAALAFGAGAIGKVAGVIAGGGGRATNARNPQDTVADNKASADRQKDIMAALKEAGLFNPDFGPRTINLFGNDPVAFSTENRSTLRERQARLDAENGRRGRF